MTDRLKKTNRPIGISKKQIRKRNTGFRILLKQQTKLLKEKNAN